MHEGILIPTYDMMTSTEREGGREKAECKSKHVDTMCVYATASWLLTEQIFMS